MTEYSETIRAFDTAYRSAILDYTKNRMTSREQTAFNAIVVQYRQSLKIYDNKATEADVDLQSITANLLAVDLEKTIHQCRNLDPEGWMVYKCNFVEDYMNSLSNYEKHDENCVDRLCLCEIDDTTSTGIVICPNISRTRYTTCMMEYTPTPLECVKISQLPGPLALAHQTCIASEKHGEGGALCKIDDAELILRSVSGCDAKGWLLHKHLFIAKEQAAAVEQEASLTHPYTPTLPPFESSLYSAVTHVLHRVRSDVQAEISRHSAMFLRSNVNVVTH